MEARSDTADLEDAREGLIRSFHAIPDELLDRADVVGTWSTRACLAHILAWDAWGAESLVTLERGESPRCPDEETINAAAVQHYGRHTAAEFERELRAGRLRIIERLAAMSDEERMEPRYRLEGRRISANDFIDGFIEHDLEHASEIRAWRKAQGL